MTPISEAIKARKITAVDVVRALAKTGYREEAENLLFMLKQRVTGDYLQTSAIFRDRKVLSALNDPNDYEGPASGYRMSEQRWTQVKTVRGTITKQNVLATEALGRDKTPQWLFDAGQAQTGTDHHEIVIGVTPAFGLEIHRTTAGHALEDVIQTITAGIAEGGGTARLVRIMHTADTSFVGLSAAKLSGSGMGIGIQSKGTAVLHKADRLPHMNLEQHCQVVGRWVSCCGFASFMRQSRVYIRPID